jgi:Transposase
MTSNPVSTVTIESMNGARYIHDTLELLGWEVEIADAQKVKGLAPLACKTDRIDAWVLAELSRRELVPAIWLPDPAVRAERERARYRLHLVRHRTMFKNRIHATLMAAVNVGGLRRGRPVLTEARWRLDADRRRTLRFFVHAHICCQPPLLPLLVDFSLTNNEAGVEPPIRLDLGRQFNACCDRTPTPGCMLIDALAMDRDENVLAVPGSEEAAEVRRPDAIFPTPRIVGPFQGSLDVAGHLSPSVAEAKRFLAPLGTSAIRLVPAGAGVVHGDLAERFDAHLRPSFVTR